MIIIRTVDLWITCIIPLQHHFLLLFPTWRARTLPQHLLSLSLSFPSERWFSPSCQSSFSHVSAERSFVSCQSANLAVLGKTSNSEGFACNVSLELECRAVELSVFHVKQHSGAVERKCAFGRIERVSRETQEVRSGPPRRAE